MCADGTAERKSNLASTPSRSRCNVLLYLQQSVLCFFWTGFESLGGIDDGDGHEADGEVPEQAENSQFTSERNQENTQKKKLRFMR